MQSSDLRWRRSTLCADGACVEIAAVHDQVRMRNSKEPDGPTLLITRTEWAAFLTGIKAGEFDRPGTANQA